MIAIAILLSKTSWFKNQPKKKSTRRYVKDVKAGEIIQIEWSKLKEGMGGLLCLNNDPETKKILLEVRWGNYKEMGCKEYEKIIFDYDSKELKNFHLLNTYREKPKPIEDDATDYDIATLQKKMNEALEKEEYEKANELQKKIDKLLKK